MPPGMGLGFGLGMTQPAAPPARGDGPPDRALCDGDGALLLDGDGAQLIDGEGA